MWDVAKALLPILEGQRKDENIRYMEDNHFKQLVTGATHLLGGHIDQAWLFGDHHLKNVVAQHYAPYYTSHDHDGLLVSLEIKEECKK